MKIKNNNNQVNIFLTILYVLLKINRNKKREKIQKTFGEYIFIYYCNLYRQIAKRYYKMYLLEILSFRAFFYDDTLHQIKLL